MFWVADEIDVNGIEILEVFKDLDVVDDVTKVCSQHDLGSILEAANLLVCRAESFLDLGW